MPVLPGGYRSFACKDLARDVHCCSRIALNSGGTPRALNLYMYIVKYLRASLLNMISLVCSENHLASSI